MNWIRRKAFFIVAEGVGLGDIQVFPKPTRSTNPLFDWPKPARHVGEVRCLIVAAGERETNPPEHFPRQSKSPRALPRIFRVRIDHR